MAKTGYTFADWNTLADGSGTDRAVGSTFAITANTTLYAQWTPNNNTITFDKNAADATGTTATQTLATGATANLNANGYTRPGYVFSGWATTSSGAVAFTNGQSYVMGTSNVTLYAVWSSTSPTITTTGSLSAMSTTYGTASANQSFTFNATNLTGTDVTVSAPAGFEISKTSGGTYGASLTYAIATGTASGSVFARLAATSNVGNYTGNVVLTDGAIAPVNVNIPNSTVIPKELFITGLSASSKIYDGNTNAIIFGSATLNGIVGSDNVSVTGTAIGEFVNKIVGISKIVNITGLSLTGTKAGNYTLPANPNTTTTATIAQRTLTVTGATAQNKPYDGTTTAVITGTLAGVVGLDNVTLTGVGDFASPNVGTSIAVTPNLDLGGDDAGNYVLTQPTGLTANILATISSAPTITTITPSNGQLSVAFTAPTNNGGTTITNYAYSINGGSTFTVIAPAQTTSPIVITGLTNGTTYSVIIRAINSLGQGADSNTLNGTPSIAAQSTDRFRSRQSGNWATASTWESSADGISWLSPTTLAPTSSAASVEIASGHNITTAATATAKNLTVKNGGRLQLNSAITNSGNFTIEDLGTVVVNFITANPATNLWAGTENFAAQSFFIVNRWDRTVELFANVNDVTTNLTTGAKFGNLNIDLGTAGITANWTGIFPLSTFNLTDGDLTISNSTTYNVTLNPQTVTIGKNFIIGGSGNVVGQSQAGTKILNVKGNFEKNGSGQFRLSNSGTSYVANLNIDGNFTVNDGTFVLDQGSTGASTSIVNLKGNLSKTTAAFMTNANGNSLTNAFNFVGNVLQTVNLNVGASNDMLRYRFFIKNGAIVTPLIQDWKLATDSKITVESGGTLDFGFDGSTPLNIVRSGSMVGQSFNAAEGSILKITSTEGIVAGNTTPALDLYKGNVQIGATAATRTFSAGAIYHYIGKAANQATGNALPDGLTNKVIIDLQTDSTNENLNLTANGSIKFNSSGTLEIRRGRVVDAPNNGFRNNIAVENEDGESDAQKGNLVMTGGRYVVSGSGTKPSLSGNYTFTGGTVEFAGPIASATTASKIRTGVTPKQYYNVDVSGSNVETGGKDFIVNELLKVTNASAVLTIPEVADSVNPYVVTAKKGIQVIAGQAIFQNNAQLMQNASAVNSGNVDVQRTVDLAGNRSQYNYLISPVIDQTMKTIFGGLESNVPFVLRYNELNDKFPNAGVGAYTPGKAYAVKQPIASFTGQAEFKGRPQNGSFSYNLEFTDSDHGSNLVGNPYPSNINIRKLYEDNTGQITEYFRFWDNKANAISVQQGSAYKGAAYAVYNATTGSFGAGVPAPGNTVVDPNNPESNPGTKTPNYIVKVGQGFLVKATSAGPLNFSNDIRITNQTDAQFFGKNQEEVIDDRYWIELITPANMVVSNAIVYFEGGNNAFAKDDTKEVGTSDALFTFASNNKVVINGRSIFNVDDVLPLGTRHFAAGIHHIKLGNKEGVFANGQNIYLKDKQNGIITNLSQNSYAFSANSGEVSSRFEIIYKPQTVLATDTNVKESLQVYRNGEDFIVKSSQNKIQKVDVYDATGRLLKSIKGNAEEIKIDASTLASGMYILNINRNNEVINKKIIK